MTRKDWKYKNFIALDDDIERLSYNHDIEIYEAIKALMENMFP